MRQPIGNNHLTIHRQIKESQGKTDMTSLILFSACIVNDSGHKGPFRVTQLIILFYFLPVLFTEGEIAEGLGEDMEDDDMANMIDQEIEGKFIYSVIILSDRAPVDEIGILGYH